jgi:glycosyltransferase involved in cell wall biosynthesis
LKIFVDARPTPGGIQRCVNELTRRFAPVPGLEWVAYGTAADWSAPVRLPTPESTRKRGAIRRALGDLKRVAFEQFEFRGRIESSVADCFLSPNGFVPRGLALPSVVLCHDLWLLDHPETKRRGWITSYERRTFLSSLQQADRVVVPSRSVLDDLTRRRPDLERKLHHIPHPLPAFDATPFGTEDPALALAEPPYLLSVGTVEPRKNLGRLLEAQRRLWPHTAIPLVLAGAYGWRQSHLLEALRSSPGVHWLGPVTDNELDLLYRHARVVVQPSLAEGFGYPMVEALQRGVPLVLSDIPVHREIAADCAEYCDPLDVCAMAEAIRRALEWNAPRRAVIAEQAEQRIAALADHTLVERWLALLGDLAA